MKKTIVFLLILALAISLLMPVYVSAESGQPATVYADNVTASGDTVEVSVRISNNPGLAAFLINLKYDRTVFSIAKQDGELAITQGNFSSAGTLIGTENKSGCKVTWFNTNDVRSDGILFKVILNVADGAEIGKYPINVSYSTKDTVNKDEELVPMSCANGSVTVKPFIPTISIPNLNVEPGNTVTLPISISDNPGIEGLDVIIEYDTGTFAPVCETEGELEITPSEAFANGLMVGAEKDYGCRILWSNTAEVKANGLFAEIKLKVLPQAKGGLYQIGLSNVAENTLNAADEKLTFVCTSGTIKVEQQIIASGTCGAQGDNLSWELDDQGVLTISGLGNMANYSGVRTPWYSYNSQIKIVVIGSGVTSIGRNAFQALTGLTSVSIPSSVTVIGEYAFDNCYKLTEISLPSSVGTIERCAFYSTTYVSVDQSNSYFKSTDGALYAKDGKTLYHVPDNYTNFIIPEQVETIFDGAFKDCVKLETLTLPSGLKSIGHMAFYNCSNLVSLTMSSNVTKIGMSAFWDCGKLTDVYYDGTEEQWNGFTSKAIAAKNNGQIQKVTVHYVSTPQGLPEFSVSHPATVNITAPENGWVIGDNTFSVSAERPCVLAVSYDGGQTYTRLTASANGDGSYSFDVNITDKNTILVCSFFGDSNGDGDLNSGDVSRLNAGILHKVTLSALSKLVCDVNNDSDLSSGDVSRLNAVILNKVKLSW